MRENILYIVTYYIIDLICYIFLITFINIVCYTHMHVYICILHTHTCLAPCRLSFPMCLHGLDNDVGSPSLSLPSQTFRNCNVASILGSYYSFFLVRSILKDQQCPSFSRHQGWIMEERSKDLGHVYSWAT